MAKPPNRSGRSMGVIMAPKPPLDLPVDASVLGSGQGPVVRVHPTHDVLAQVGVVLPGPRRVHELRSPVDRPGVHVHDDAGWGLPAGEELVGHLGERLAISGAVGPHGEVAGVTLDDVHRRVPPPGIVVVARRDVHPQRTVGRIAEMVALERRGMNRVAVESASQLCFPGQSSRNRTTRRHGHTLARGRGDFSLGHRSLRRSGSRRRN